MPSLGARVEELVGVEESGKGTTRWGSGGAPQGQLQQVTDVTLEFWGRDGACMSPVTKAMADCLWMSAAFRDGASEATVRKAREIAATHRLGSVVDALRR